MHHQNDIYFRKLDPLGYILAPSVKSPLVTPPTIQVKKTIQVCNISKTVGFRAKTYKIEIVGNQILGGKVVSHVNFGQ